MRLVITRGQHVLASYALLAILGAAVVSAVVATPAARRIGFTAKLDELRSTHARSIAALERNERVRKAVAARQARGDSKREVYQADTAALAGAQLQNELRTLIESEGGMLLSSAFRQSSEPLPLTPVSVSVRMQSSTESLLRILRSLEGRQPALFVDNLVIQGRNRPGRPIKDAREELDVEFDVTGYLDRKVEQ
jgi:general secretion pathway protein M